MASADYKKWNLRAFTLLELLVVISIIAMLMAVTMPSLNKAREAGKKAVCLSNVKQLTIAWLLYAHNNNDKMCAADTDWNGTQPWDGTLYMLGEGFFWVSDGAGFPDNPYPGTELSITNGILWPYLEHLDIYKCTSYHRPFARSYGISHAMGSIHEKNGERNFHTLSEISMPAKKMVFVDFNPPIRDFDGYIPNVGPGGSIEFINTFSKTWSFMSREATARHNNGHNLSFADSHVEYWKWKDPRSRKLIDGTVGAEESSVNNEDLERLYEAMKGSRDKQF